MQVFLDTDIFFTRPASCLQPATYNPLPAAFRAAAYAERIP